MARRRKYTEPIMTNSAAIRVLYDLAGGRVKTWPALGRDLDINVDDIYKRNRPWPSDFGRVRYREAFRKYADEVHTSRYATILAVRRSLQDSCAYTDEVKAIVENVRADSDEKLVDSALERLLDTIVETARPYNEIPASCRVGADAGERTPEEEAGGSCAQASCAAGLPEGPCVSGSAGEREGGAGRPAEEGPGRGGAPGMLTLRLLAACLAGTDGCGRPWYEAASPVRAVALPVAARRRVALRAPLDAERFLGALLPPALFGPLAEAGLLDEAMDAALEQGVRDGLACALCSDEGLGCRTALRRCAALLAGADEGAFFASADWLLACLGAPYGDAAAPMPDAVLRAYLRFGDGDAARCLFVLALLGLLGADGLTRVVTCRQTLALFGR